jgi:uncharacterized protein involved in type VI secretion and phage assembly
MNAALQSLMKGLVLAEVVDVDDPEKLGRVKVSFLTLSATEPGDWCDIARPLASGGFGIWVQPLPGDLVVAGFLEGRIEKPVILGAIFTGDAKPPTDKQPQVMLQTRSGHSLLFDDTEGDEAITLTDKTGNMLKMSKDGITIESPKDITLKGKNVTVEASAQLTGKGAPIHLNP